MHTSPHTRTRPRPRRWGHERWWSKPKSHDGERQLDARRPRDPGRLRRARRRARTTRSGAPHPRGGPPAVLDKDLAPGDSPLRSHVHALRARQLVDRRSRERLARALERLVEGAERTPSPSEIAWLLEARDPRSAHGAPQPGAPAARRATGIRVRGGNHLANGLRWHRASLHARAPALPCAARSRRPQTRSRECSATNQ